MKNIYLILMVLIGTVFVSSCSDKLEEMNIDEKHPTEVPGNYLFSNAQKALADQVASTNVNINNWKLWSQYWTETTYTDESNYDVVTRDIASHKFRIYYRDILKDLEQAKSLIGQENPIADADIIAKKNRLAIIDIIKAYAYQRLVDMFGNVPFTNAMDIENISPAYDDAFTIYKTLIDQVNTALNDLDDTGGSFGSADLYYGGDVSMWKKFANTLKVKMGITLADVDNGLAKSTIESAYDKGFAFGENCEMAYLGGINANPLFQDLIQSGRHDFVAANTIVDAMNALDDPRRYPYFTKVDTSDNGVDDPVYLGGQYGHSSPYANFSHIPNTLTDAGDRLPSDADGSNIADATFPMVLLDYTELAFYLAEAAERGYSVGKSAEEWYNEGIKSSMNFWLGKHYGAADVDQMTNDYLAKPEVAYATAAGDWKQKIGTQAWIAFYYRGFVGYTSYRRLDWPKMNTPPSPPQEIVDAGIPVPTRITYPIAEQTLNADNYYQASDAIGGDLLTTKIFWDKH